MEIKTREFFDGVKSDDILTETGPPVYVQIRRVFVGGGVPVRSSSGLWGVLVYLPGVSIDEIKE